MDTTVANMQAVLQNLMIAAIEFRSDDDPDIRPYVHDRCVDMCIVQPSSEITACRSSLVETLRGIIARLCNMKVCTASHSAAIYAMLASTALSTTNVLQADQNSE